MDTQLDQIALLRQIAEAQSGTFVVKDDQRRYLLVNQFFADLVGFPSERFIGLTDEELHRLGVPASEKLSTCAHTPLVDEHENVTAYLVQHPTSPASQREPVRLVDRSDQLMSVFNELLARLMAYQALDPLLQHIAEVMFEYTVCDNALILMVNETAEFMQVVASAGPASSDNIGQRRIRGQGLAGMAWDSAEIQFIPDSDANLHTRGFWPSGTQLLAVPMLSDTEVIGVAVLGSSGNQDDFRMATGLVSNLAKVAGIAINSAQLIEHSRKELQRTRALSEISAQLAQFGDTQELFKELTKTLMDAMDISRASIYTLTNENKLLPQIAWGRVDGIITHAQTMPSDLVDGTIGNWCYQHRKPALIARNTEDPRESEQVRALRAKLNFGSILCRPIYSDKRVVGILQISRDSTRRNFDENEMNLFSSICDQLSNALSRHDLSQALHHQAHHDALTQLPNRRQYESELLHLVRQTCAEPKNPGAVMFLDLDGFKQVNDSFGHAIGDQLLQQVAHRLRGIVPETDTLARIGGDEFAVIVRQLTNHQAAVDLAQKLVDSLKAPFTIEDKLINIATSVGLSFFPADGQSTDNLLRKADEAMYRAKKSGQGQICCYSEHMGTDITPLQKAG